jgi:thiol-disulfide isomerase/thioredoxin
MKALYISLFVLASMISDAQSTLYNKLNSFIDNQTKEEVSNRLIAINIWSANNKVSRAINDEFDEVYKVYEFAKLKGGNKGIVVLNINLDSDPVNTDILLEKDGISKAIKVPTENTEIVNLLKEKPAGYNIVFDENGNVVYENLAQGTIFTAIQKLITR